jgi:hypothetical protein
MSFKYIKKMIIKNMVTFYVTFKNNSCNGKDLAPLDGGIGV